MGDNAVPTNARVRPVIPEHPDSDAIKMFVGQVPRTMDESELKVSQGCYFDYFQFEI